MNTARRDASATADHHATAIPDERGLVVYCFGNFEVTCQGRPVQDWRRDKARSLLKLLIARQGSIQRDVLIDALWPDLEPEAALRNLRVTLHALRKALDGGASGASEQYVLTNGDALELNMDVPLWVDTATFQNVYGVADDLWRRGRFNDAIRAYDVVEQLYRDDYLLDDLYTEWTVIPRERLKDQYLLAVTRLADVALNEAEYERCIDYSHKILARDGSREDAYVRLMRCHAQMGRRTRALRWFEICRDFLQREINVDPSARTLELARRIAAGSVVQMLAS